MQKGRWLVLFGCLEWTGGMEAQFEAMLETLKDIEHLLIRMTGQFLHEFLDIHSYGRKH